MIIYHYFYDESHYCTIKRGWSELSEVDFSKIGVKKEQQELVLGGGVLDWGCEFRISLFATSKEAILPLIEIGRERIGIDWRYKPYSGISLDAIITEPKF